MAIRYLCPICDHELVARGYCPSCKKFIKEPVEYKGFYLPNEDTGNYTLNRSMPESERRSVVNPRYRTDQSGTNTTRVAGRTYTAQTSSRTNTRQTSSRTYTTTASSGKVNTDYGNCGGHKDSDYGKPNVDPHTPRKKKKSIFSYIILIYIIIIVLKILFDN